MSSHWQAVGKQAAALRPLCRDVAGIVGNGAGWDATVDGTHSLGEGAPVERWYLAEYFLTAWHEWRTLLVRYGRYFGNGARASRATWKQLWAECAATAEVLQGDALLDGALAASWRQLAEGEAGGEAGGEIDACELFHDVVASHNRVGITRDAIERGPRSRVDWAPAWIDAIRAAREADRQVQKRAAAVAPAARDALAWHLRKYRHSTLDVSWLDERRWVAGDDSSRTAFEQLLGRPTPPPAWIAELVQSTEGA